MKILYVEDNMANLYLMKRIAHGHEVVNYIDGQEALEHFYTLKPDLVFMDIQLAGELSGLDVVQVLRERGDITPIVAVTAYAMVGDREKCVQAGCNDYLAKPLPIPEVLAIIKRYDPANRSPKTTDTVEPPASPAATLTATSEAPVVPRDDITATTEAPAAAQGEDDTSPELSEVDPITKPDARLS